MANILWFYQAFEAAVIADYDVESAVERELVLRLSVEQMIGLRAKVDTGVENDKAPVARSGPSS